MKTGMKSRLGLGFMAALAALTMTQPLTAGTNNRDVIFNSSLSGGVNRGSLWYFTRNPNRKRKVNKLRLSHNAKLKRRRAA
jgi:hypothetical protein